jgi:hypothetical protein
MYGSDFLELLVTAWLRLNGTLVVSLIYGEGSKPLSLIYLLDHHFKGFKAIAAKVGASGKDEFYSDLM